MVLGQFGQVRRALLSAEFQIKDRASRRRTPALPFGKRAEGGMTALPSFRELFSRATGQPPFRYQERLAITDASRVFINVPTGAGKAGYASSI